MAYSFDNPEVIVDITPNNEYLKAQFHPQGFSFYRADDGRKYLFVINRRTGTKTVELFEINGVSLTHLETFKDPKLMTNPNNLVAVGPRQFYLSNYRVSSSNVGQQLEQLLALPVSYVLYFDGSKFQKVATGIIYANGVEASNDGTKIYVSSSLANEIQVYSRDIASGELERTNSIQLGGTSADNLFVDEDDNIWLAALPGSFDFLMYRYQMIEYSPSQVLKFIPDEKGEFISSEPYLNSGEQLAASTSVGPYKNRMLLGGVYSDHFLDCVK
jgi:arylesterase/paraoxonase